MFMNRKFNLLILLSLAGSVQAISFRDYYHGNRELGIPSEQDLVDSAVEDGYLILSNENITNLDGLDEVPNISQIHSLDLSGNQLKTIPEDILNSLVNLRAIRLDGNQFTMLPTGIFNGLVNLRVICARNNQLTTLSQGIFTGLTNLSAIDFDGNQLNTLPSAIFSGLANLQWISLAENRLTIFPADIVRGLNSLISLNLYGNPLLNPEQLQKEFTSQPNLVLYLKKIRAGAGRGIPFRDYYYGNKALGIASHEYEINSSVRRDSSLDLNDINLSDLNGFDEIPGLSNLNDLSLFGNQLTTLPVNIFLDCISLTTLILEENKLLIIPATSFNGLANLRTLNLSSNFLLALEKGTFNGLIQLETLDLNDNPLRILPVGIFHGLNKLSVLSLGNTLRSTLVQGIFNGLANLTLLDLGGNNITTLPPHIFSPLVKLEYLYLDDNQISVLPAHILAGLKRLKLVKLYNNPISLSTEKLRTELELKPKVKLYFKRPEQILVEQQLFDAIRNGDIHAVRNLYKTIMVRGVKIPDPDSSREIDIAKIRDANGNNLVQLVVKALADRVANMRSEITQIMIDNSMSEGEKKTAAEVIRQQIRAAEARYLKIFMILIQFGGPKVEDLLLTRDKNGDDVLATAVGTLGKDSTFVKGMILVAFEEQPVGPVERFHLKPRARTEKTEAEEIEKILAEQYKQLQRRPLELTGAQFENAPATMEKAPEALEAKRRNEQEQNEAVAQPKRARALRVLGLTPEQDNSQLIAARFKKLSDEYAQINSSSAPAEQKAEAERRLHELHSAWTYLTFGR